MVFFDKCMRVYMCVFTCVRAQTSGLSSTTARLLSRKILLSTWVTSTSTRALGLRKIQRIICPFTYIGSLGTGGPGLHNRIPLWKMEVVCTEEPAPLNLCYFLILKINKTSRF